MVPIESSHRYVYAIRSLGKKIFYFNNCNLKDTVMVYPFLDGPIICEIMQHYWEKEGWPYKDQITNVLELSSKSNNFDRDTFREKLSESDKFDLIVVDLRTGRKEKKGSLQEIIEKEVESFNTDNNTDKKHCYAVCFDYHLRADIQGSTQKLSNADRINWVSREEYEELKETLLSKPLDHGLAHDIINKIPAVKEIKKLI
ncbi:MAG: hypothetical protein JSW73_00900 [Candidatus Woesearchaeota archaeon]|nr:MAG: hypothetical protein JSW73_00900 [Candidatus Woesearchaeota archaeon]